MPPFPKPSFAYNYDVDVQLAALRQYEATKPGRSIPAKAADHLLLATWNIANLGVQERREQDYRLLAEVVSWFDLVAIQEVNDNLRGLRSLRQFLPPSYRILFSDASGNNERLAYCYDADKVTLLEKVGEVAIPPRDLRRIAIQGITQKFDGFDRSPYLAAFRVGGLEIVLVNVHLFFGSDSSKRDMNRRALETFAVARWADLRWRSQNAFSPHIVPLGDFNLPIAQPGDPIYDALISRGLLLPAHSSEMGSSLRHDRHYDQIAFVPGPLQTAATAAGIFDFDGALFASLWETRGEKDFLAYTRYYVSDHRPLWTQFHV